MNLPKDSVGSGGAANVYQGTELWVRSGQSVRPPDVPEADGTVTDWTYLSRVENIWSKRFDGDASTSV